MAAIPDRVVIPLNESQTAPLVLPDHGLVIVHVPAVWTAAAITFLVKNFDGSFQPFFDSDNVEYAIAAAAGRSYGVAPDATRGMGTFKLRSGTSALPVNQAAERILGITLLNRWES